MDERRLLIYADTHQGVGAGHLVRCLALAEAWIDDGGVCTLVTERWPDGFEQVAGVDLSLLDGEPAEGLLTDLIIELSPMWLVIDGYRMAPPTMVAIADGSTRLAVLRDHGMAAPPADLIIDQNAGADAAAYIADAPSATVLAGVDYALLRRSFRVARERRVPAAERPGLVMAGGSPAPAVVDLITRATEVLSPDAVELLGGGFEDAEMAPSVRQLGVVSDPATAMRGRRWALTPAGSTAWELCCLGVPSVLFAAAPNQEGVGLAVAEAGAGTYLGPLETLTGEDVAVAVRALVADAGRRADMGRTAAAMVDGLGARRVVAELRASSIELAEVTPDHARLLFEWRNDPDVRASSFSSEPIAWADHVVWLDQQLEDDQTWMFVAVEADRPVGQIRFDVIEPGQLRVGVSLAPEARGKRLAAPVIAAGTRAALARSGAASVRAEVKAENDRSAAAFVAAGYGPVSDTDGVLTFERPAR